MTKNIDLKTQNLNTELKVRFSNKVQSYLTNKMLKLEAIINWAFQ